VGALGRLSPSSTEGGHAIIESAHVLILMPLLVSDLGVNPVLHLLQGVLYLGFILIECGLQRILDLGLGFPQGGSDSLYDDPLEGLHHGWVHCCKENTNVVLGLVSPRPHGGRQNVLTRPEFDSPPMLRSAYESSPATEPKDGPPAEDSSTLKSVRVFRCV